MDTDTAEDRYLADQRWLNQESRYILSENAKRAEMLAEGYCEDCASGYNLFIGCGECSVHSTKRICMHDECHGSYCITEYDT